MKADEYASDYNSDEECDEGLLKEDSKDEADGENADEDEFQDCIAEEKDTV